MTDARRYVVRLGKVRGEGDYCRGRDGFGPSVFKAFVTRDRTTADNIARGVLGRVVRLLSPAEAKRKAAAVALREHAARCRQETKCWRNKANEDDSDERPTVAASWRGLARGYEKAAEDAERDADALWPLPRRAVRP